MTLISHLHMSSGIQYQYSILVLLVLRCSFLFLALCAYFKRKKIMYDIFTISEFIYGTFVFALVMLLHIVLCFLTCIYTPSKLLQTICKGNK